MAYHHSTAVREVLQDNPQLYPVPVETSRVSETRRIMASKDVSRSTPEEVIREGAATVSEMLEALRQDSKFVTLDSMAAMADAMAEDDDTTPQEALKKLQDNQARAFTAEKTGLIYFLQCDERAHDEIHETVHVTSAPGGTTRIKREFGDPLNEAFTEMFTIEYCQQLGVPLAAAYDEEVRFAKQLRKVVGLPMLHAAYLQNEGMDAIIAKLSTHWHELTSGQKVKFSLQKFIAPTDDEERRALLTQRLAHGAFLGEAKLFWKVLLS